MPGIQYSLDLDAASFKQGAAQSMDYINQLHGRIDKLTSAGAGGNSFLKSLSTTLFQLPQQVMALQGIMTTLAIPSKLAASAESTAVAFRVLVGDAAKADAVLSKVRKLADSTPFEFPELADASRKLIAFGEAAGDVPETLRRIGDVSAGIQAPISEIADLYGKARVQGTLFAEDINQLTGRGVPIIKEFAEQLNVTQGEVKQLASQGRITFPMLEKAFSDLTSGAGQFSGMMEAVSRTMEGRLSTLSDSFKGAMSAVGEGLNEALKPLLSGASEKIDGLKDKAKEFGKTLGAAVDTAVVLWENGDIGGVILEGFKAGALTVAEGIINAVTWGGEFLAAKIKQSMPFGDKKEGAAQEKVLRQSGFNAPGVGIDSISESAGAARKTLNDRLAGISTQTAARKAQRAAEQASYDDEAKAKKEAATKAADAAARAAESAKMDKMIGDAVDQPGPRPEQGGRIKSFKTGAEYDQAQTRRKAIEDLGKGRPSMTSAPAPARADLPIPAGAPEEFHVRENLRQTPSLGEASPAMDRAARGRKSYGTHRIRGAGFRGGPRLNLDPSQQDTMQRGAPSPADLGQATGRGQQRQKKMAGDAAAAQEKQQAGNAAGASDDLLKSIATNVERIAKATEAEGTL